MQEEYKNEIESYYDESLRDYEIVWQLKDAMALHYGYWDNNTNTHKQALWNMNFQVAKNAQITAKDYVLDAGCGVGGTSFFLANNIGCKIHGISLAQAHIHRANTYKKENDPNNLVEFSCQNFCHTNFKDNSFDVVFGIESIVHASNKNDFLKEAFRVLKPGGRLLVSDYFLRNPKNSEEKNTLAKWGKSWAIDDFIYENRFKEDLNAAGFTNIFLNDITPNVYPSIKLMHRSYYPGIVFSSVSNLFGKSTKKRLENSKSGKYQYQSFKQGVWEYKHLLAFKPPCENYNTIEAFLQIDEPCKVYVDNESFKEQFPIISKKGFKPRHILKRMMHFYLENNIKNSNRKF